MRSFKDVPIPPRMLHLDRDDRGFPIPVMVFRDNDGRPHFTINSEATRYLLFIDDQCSICGQKLLKARWFVGGPLSAFHENGSYYDPPLHRECMRYAMQVCPYLALSSYTKRIEARTITDNEPGRIFIDTTQDPTKPAVFVCVEATGQRLHQTPGLVGPIYVIPHRPYRSVEFWRNGIRVDNKEGMQIAREKLVEYTR